MQISNRRWSLFLALAAVLALILRLLVVWELHRIQAVASPPPVTDMRTYLDFAAGIARGRLPPVFYYQPFYYSVFLPVVFLLFGYSAAALGVVQAIVGAAAVWLVGWSGARMFGQRAGVLSALALALARFHIFYTPFALMAVLQSFWLAAIVACAVWAGRRRSALWRWAVFGLIFGFANLTRGNVALLLPGVLVYLLMTKQGSRRGILCRGAVFLLLMFSVQLPFALYNTRALGRLAGPSTAGDAVLALGNNPEAPPGGLVYTPTYETWMSKTGARGGVKAATVPGLILDWIGHEPLAWLELKFRTFLLFWAPLEIPNNVNIDFQGSESLLLQLPVLLEFWALSVLGLAGMALCLLNPVKRRLPAAVFAGICILLYCAATAAFYMLARFRLPVVPLLCIFAGYSLHRLWGDLRVCRRRKGARQWRMHLAVTLLLLLLPALFVLHGFGLYRYCLEAPIMRAARPNGVMALDGERVLVYDNGPRYLGGWMPAELPPSGGTLSLHKTFAPPLRQEVARRRPASLRLPVLFTSGGEIDIVVQERGQVIGEFRGRMEPSEPVQFLEVEHGLWLSPYESTRFLEVEIEPADADYAGKPIALDVLIRADTPSAAYIIIDRQRNYRRSWMSRTDLPFDIARENYELCMQLVFE